MKVPRTANLRQRTLMTAGFAAAVIVVITAYQIWHTYRAAVENARRDSTQLVQIFGASSDATLQALELIADQAVAEVRGGARPPAPNELDSRFITIAAQWPFVHAVLYTDPDGIARNVIVRGADGALHGVDRALDLSARDYFKFHRDSNPTGQSIFLSDPLVSMLSGELVIVVTKKVTGPDGSFAGLVSVGVTVDSLARIFAGLLPARYSGVGLFKRSGGLLAAAPPSADVSRPFHQAPPISDDDVATGAKVYRLTDPEDGTERLAAFVASKRYPVVVAVTALWSDALAPWQSGTTLLGTTAATGVLIILGLAWWQMLRIRDEQAAQLALTASERSLIESQRLAGIAHFERDLRSNAVTWSENMYVMHGVDPRTFVPCRATLLDLIVSEDRARMLFRLEMIDQQRETVGTVETKIRLPSGETRNIQYGWRLLGGQDGTRPRIFGIAKDMTAMRAAEATIRNDEERLRDIVECSGDYIWESNAAGTVTFFSGEPKRIDFMSDIVRMETGPSTVRSDSEALRHAIDARVKFRNLVVPANDEDGELVWVRVSANPRFDEQGNFLGYRGAGTDVTDVKHEQERDEHRRKSEALGRLAGGLAHEINNLLQPILIYAAFGASSRAGDVQQYFSRIARAAEQATLIVKNVLTSARQSPPLRENVDVQAVIRETADLLSGTLPQGVALEIVCEADDIFVRVDRTGLAQLLTNLVTNASEALAEAARATGQKSGRIEVSAALVLLSAEAARALGLQPAAYCRLCVADDGPGIVREHIDKVFEPFFTTKPQGKGTGLGLSVVSGLAKSWGGTVSVASTPGESTRFVVYLPLAERQLQAAQ